MKQNRTNNDDPRFECPNWDEPEVRVKRSSGHHSTMARKVKTIGTKLIDASGVISASIKHLRQGKEVYLVDMLNPSPIPWEGAYIRLFPVASKDCTKIYVAAQAMTALSQCMTDKKPVVVRGKNSSKEKLNTKEVGNLVAEQEQRHEEFAKRISVTPDTVVECPKCGYEFRVGKQLKG